MGGVLSDINTSPDAYGIQSNQGEICPQQDSPSKMQVMDAHVPMGL